MRELNRYGQADCEAGGQQECVNSTLSEDCADQAAYCKPDRKFGALISLTASLGNEKVPLDWIE